MTDTPRSVVWMVTTGAYDDFAVRGIFSTRSLADAHAAALNDSAAGTWQQAYVYEVPLDVPADVAYP